MRKENKVKNEKFYTELILNWFRYKKYYNHDLDCWELYNYMYYTAHLSWHKVQRIIFKNISKEILDELSY